MITLTCNAIYKLNDWESTTYGAISSAFERLIPLFDKVALDAINIPRPHVIQVDGMHSHR